MLYSLIVGAIAGWLGSKLFKGSSSGLIINIVLGIVGAFVGSWAFGVLNINISGGILADIIKGASGAVLVLFIYNAVSKK